LQQFGQLAIDVDLAGVDCGLDPVRRRPDPGDVLTTTAFELVPLPL
jgi:hypothetical protein